MSKIRLLVFASSVIGTDFPGFQGKIFEEYTKLSESMEITVIAEEIAFDKMGKNFALVKVSKISFPIIKTIYGMVVFPMAAIKNRKKYDIVFNRYRSLPFLITAIVCKVLLKKKIVVYLSESGTVYRGFRKTFFKPFLRYTLKIADAVATSSERVINDVEKYTRKIDRTKLFIMRQDTINTSIFKPTKEKNDNILLSVGRINPVKGFEIIIESLPSVIKKFPDVILRIVGSVDDEEYLQKLKTTASRVNCEKNVEFIGPVPYSKIGELYNSSTIFILTSKDEGQPNVLVEAMACGKPVIATPVGAILDVINDGVNGFIVKENQHETLSKKIINLLEDKALREKIGEAAQKTIEEKYAGDVFSSQLKNVFEKVAKN